MRTLFLSLLVTLSVAAGLSWLWAGAPRESLVERRPRAELPWPEAPPFEEQLAAEAPELVVLGNSVTAAAVDVPRLGELLGKSAMDMTIHGSASALWYILVKNVVTAGPHRPKTLVLGFRDVYLTEPDFRTQGGYSVFVDWFAGPREPLLDRLAYFRGTGALELFALEHWSVWQERTALRASVEDFAKDDVAAAALGLEPVAIRAAVDRVFAEERKRAEAVNAAQTAAEAQIERFHFDFEDQLEQSFLPEIIRLCRDGGVRLVLVRLPNRRTAQAAAENVALPAWSSEWLPPYMAELFAYLEDEGVAVLDFDGDPRVPFAWYAAGDHLGPDPGMHEFTGFLAEALRPLID